MTITPQADDGSSKQQVDAEACFAWASNSSNMTRPAMHSDGGEKMASPTAAQACVPVSTSERLVNK